ncbi:MAG: isochorismatase family protein, partial [Lysinibacillus sp.]
MLTKDQTALVIIDVQGKLAQIVEESELVIQNIVKAVQCANVLELPILWLEQYPKGLGPTVETIAQEINGTPIEKITFSAYDNEQ